MVETIEEGAMQETEAQNPMFPPASAKEISGLKVQFRRVCKSMRTILSNLLESIEIMLVPPPPSSSPPPHTHTSSLSLPPHRADSRPSTSHDSAKKRLAVAI